MPYISTEKVKEIRVALKKAIPGYKLSVIRRHYNEVNVIVREGKIDLKVSYEQVNEYYFKDHYKDKPELILLISVILDTIQNTFSQKEIVNDADYGSIPNYYIFLEIGEWNRPYLCN